MASRLKDIEFGTVDIKDFAYWINERHRIYLRKEAGDKKPWTEDKILQQYKFTNAFRELDRGTVALHDMIDRHDNDPALLFFNIVWYRLFNWYEHAYPKIGGIGWVDNFTKLETYIEGRHRTYKKIFTGAHMTTGVAFEDKHETYLRACKEAWDRRNEFASYIKDNQTMEAVYEKVRELYMVGKFIAYELVCDFRFTTLLCMASDKKSWANMGPGAQRGLKRLGLHHKNQEQGCESMRGLYTDLTCLTERLLSVDVIEASVPFELREIEHSLCEFDKYCRVQNGEGRPRGRYPGGVE